MRRFAGLAAVAASVIALLSWQGEARAEAKELRVAKQFGLGYLQFFVMEDQKLVEQQAKAAGLGDVAVSWSQFRSSDVMNDALISGSVDFVCLGVPGIATIWAKTRGNIDVRAVSGLNQLPLFLLTRNPEVKSLKDFTDKDRIAIPSIKVSSQAIYLQMAAEKAFGPGKHTALDHLVVALSHPDALAAMLNPSHEVNAHAATQPFHKIEINAGAHTIATFIEAAGGPATGLNFVSTEKFRDENPKAFASVVSPIPAKERQA